MADSALLPSTGGEAVRGGGHFDMGTECEMGRPSRPGPPSVGPKSWPARSLHIGLLAVKMSNAE